MAIKSIEITNLTNNQLYGFRMFPRNLKGQYQTRNDRGTATATPKSGIPVSSLPVGTLIKDVNTKYYNEPIVWKIADQNHTGYPQNSTTLISDKILTMKCFDAKEPNNIDSSRRQRGNNRYSVSNIRQWLNSNSGAGKWYSAQHSSDAPPNISNTDYNAYDIQAGFLNTFSNQFINNLLDTALITSKNTITDGGGSEVFTDIVFLASNTELGFENANGVSEGTKLSIFTDNSSRISKVTSECVDNSNYTSNPTAEEAWFWWLRTPSLDSSSITLGIDIDGSSRYLTARSGNIGVRPLCNIKNNTLVSFQPDTDGAYIIQF